MFKMDKKTHLTILFTFAVLFIVIYLYYTIRDVRKAQVDIKKLQDELSVVKVLATTVGSLQTDIEDIKNTKHIRTNIDVCTLAPPSQVIEAKEPVSLQETNDHDDVSSVDTEEIRDILDGEDNEEDGDTEDNESSEDNENSESNEETEQDKEGDVTEVAEKNIPTTTPESLKNMKVDELKDLCRSYNIPSKGNKNDLLVRIFEHLGMN